MLLLAYREGLRDPIVWVKVNGRAKLETQRKASSLSPSTWAQSLMGKAGLLKARTHARRVRCKGPKMQAAPGWHLALSPTLCCLRQVPRSLCVSEM